MFVYFIQYTEEIWTKCDAISYQLNVKLFFGSYMNKLRELKIDLKPFLKEEI